jgi:cold shock CspA family protein
MKQPLQITFRNMPTSEAVASVVREKAAKLHELNDGILSLRVTIASLSHRHQQGNVYRVMIDMLVDGEELVFGREHNEDHSREDIYVAVRDAFDGARRVLQDFVDRQRHEVKTHIGPPHGRVLRIFEDDGYGFIETADGREIYFHKNSVLKHGWNRLTVGTEVRFEEEDGDKGPQASTVAIVGNGKRKHAA